MGLIIVSAEDELFSHQRGFYRGSDAYENKPKLVENEIKRIQAEVEARMWDWRPRKPQPKKPQVPLIAPVAPVIVKIERREVRGRPKGENSVWSKKRVRLLKKLVLSNATNEEIANIMRMNKMQIKYAVHTYALEEAKIVGRGRWPKKVADQDH